MKRKLTNIISSLKTPEGFFLAVSLCFGGLFMVTIPPFQSPDEAAHFLRAYQISDLSFVPDRQGNIVGSYLPKSLQQTENVVNGGTPLQGQVNTNYHLGNTKAALFDVPLAQNDKAFVDTAVTAPVSPIGYLPQVVAIWVGRIFSAPPILLIYMAKMAVLATWMTFVFWAIKLFPFKKWAVAGVALLPMVVAQSVSMGADVMAVGAGLLFTSIIIASIYRKASLSPRLLTVLVASAIIMVLSKQMMMFLLPLLLLCRFDSVVSSKAKSVLIKTALLAVPLLLMVVWSFLIPDKGSSVTEMQNGQDTGGQIHYLLGQPLSFIETLFNTFIIPGPGDAVLSSIIGNFGWFDTPLSLTFVILGYIALAMYLVISYGEKGVNNITKGHRIALFGIVTLYFFGICGALYLVFSPVGADVITGVQGRYLFPAVFLLVPFFFTSLVVARKKHFITFVWVMSVALLVASAVTIINRYYLNEV